VEQEYLPHDLVKSKATFFVPKNEGAEAKMHIWLASRKRALRKP
jgi:hypothetical protein